MSTGSASGDPPVSVMVTRRPLPGREAEFEAYLQGITQAAQSQPGHLGSTIFRPSGGADPSYRILFKFDRRSNLERWEQSAEREEWRALAEQVSEPRQVQMHTGLEAWFTLPAQPVNLPPPKHKMALIVWLGIYTLVTGLSALIGPLIADWPLPLRIFVITVPVVILMTYAVMPFLTRLFACWLYPQRD